MQDLHCNGLSIIVPAYNEEQGIRLVLRQIVSVVADFHLPWEIIVVDDGSQDATASLVQEMGIAKVVQHKSNRGYGAALKSGIRRARFDLICIIDADGTYPSTRIPDLISRILDEDLDMVVGARIKEQNAIPMIRRPAKWLLLQLAQWIVNEQIADLNSGLRVFRRSTVLGFVDLLPDGFSFTTTITLAMLTNNYLVAYLPIEYFPRVGKSKLKPIRDTINFFHLVLRIALYFAPMKFFLPISGILFLLALCWAMFGAFVLGRIADASTAVIVMSGVQVAMIGLLAELINKRLLSYKKLDDDC